MVNTDELRKEAADLRQYGFRGTAKLLEDAAEEIERLRSALKPEQQTQSSRYVVFRKQRFG